ncbi:RNA ligase family protein [Streptomyces sp. NPDC006638]|uniref:RNA ligase family protein n=1 Tax=Streptomyces sp. NPDC006638 TaxID=3157183 RepID=UPI00339F0681
MAEFTPWPRTVRLFRAITITEKLDGTNAALHISPDGQVVAQSRNRLITPNADHHGFAGWAREHAEELAYILGPGLHFGEWWGRGIQRGYGMEDRCFSVFNTDRWRKNDGPDTSKKLRAEQSSILHQIDAVPVLYQGVFDQAVIQGELMDLHWGGSVAAPGFMNPEGICVYHSQSRTVFKVTLDNNDAGKWEAA